MTPRPQLRLIETSPPQRPPRLTVRISARSQSGPHGLSRAFKIHEGDLQELLTCAERIEAKQ